MDKRSASGDTSGLVTAAVAGVSVLSFAGAWLWTRVRQSGVDERTCARLAGGATHVFPSAVEIHVGTSR